MCRARQAEFFFLSARGSHLFVVIHMSMRSAHFAFLVFGPQTTSRDPGGCSRQQGGWHACQRCGESVPAQMCNQGAAGWRQQRQFSRRCHACMKDEEYGSRPPVTARDAACTVFRSMCYRERLKFAAGDPSFAFVFHNPAVKTTGCAGLSRRASMASVSDVFFVPNIEHGLRPRAAGSLAAWIRDFQLSVLPCENTVLALQELSCSRTDRRTGRSPSVVDVDSCCRQSDSSMLVTDALAIVGFHLCAWNPAADEAEWRKLAGWVKFAGFNVQACRERVAFAVLKLAHMVAR